MSSSKLYSYYIALILLLVGLNLQAQPNKTQFEQERKRLLEHIRSIKKILSQTESKQKVTTGQLTAINKQIENNHLLAQSLNQELDAINKQLAQQLHQIAHLEKELAQLKKEYASMAYLGAKTMHDIHLLAFIFSAASFQELLQRLSAIKQYTRLRQKHFQEIQHVRLALQAQQKSLEQQGLGKNALLQKWRKEQTKLTNLKQQQTKIIATLEQRHTQLLKELHQRNDAVKRLDHLITDLVKRETAIAQQQKQETTTISKVPSKKLLTPAMAALTAAFTQHRGKLPWPVKTGFISSKFGIQPHAVLQNIQVENLGIDIQTQEESTVRSIFSGIVKTIAFVPGMNQVVIIQHGNYHTVYAKLKSTSVKVGQHVESQKPIGIVYTNKSGLTELQLQIWKGPEKLNPAGWLTKQPTG